VTSPAGPCEWCGGPQNWTIIRGEMYVRCQTGCLPLSLEGLVPSPPFSERSEELERSFHEGSGTLNGVGGVPCEGGDADTGEEDDTELPF